MPTKKCHDPEYRKACQRRYWAGPTSVRRRRIEHERKLMARKFMACFEARLSFRVIGRMIGLSGTAVQDQCEKIFYKVVQRMKDPHFKAHDQNGSTGA